MVGIKGNARICALCVLGLLPGPMVADESNPELRPQVRFQTNQGAFTVELDAVSAPVAATHFMDHVESGYYNGTLIHRVIPNGLIQGGAYLPSMERKTGGTRPPANIERHTGLSHVRGTIALIVVSGREDVPPAEFFINVSTNTGLDEAALIVSYVPIGTVTEGQELVDRLSNVPTKSHPAYAAGLSAVVPESPVVIESVSVLRRLDRAAAKQVMEERIRRAEREKVEQESREERDFQAAEAKLAEAARAAGREVVVTPSGLRYVDLRVGGGAQPAFSDRISLNFRGTLLDGTTLNDTFLDEKPATKRVKELVAGLREGVTTMNEGGRRLFLVPPSLAFGTSGIPGRVAPNSWMMYELELLEVLAPEP